MRPPDRLVRMWRYRYPNSSMGCILASKSTGVSIRRQTLADPAQDTRGVVSPHGKLNDNAALRMQVPSRDELPTHSW
jgi:hypothetical protein